MSYSCSDLNGKVNIFMYVYLSSANREFTFMFPTKWRQVQWSGNLSSELYRKQIGWIHTATKKLYHPNNKTSIPYTFLTEYIYNRSMIVIIDLLILGELPLYFSLKMESQKIRFSLTDCYKTIVLNPSRRLNLKKWSFIILMWLIE